MSAGQQLAIPIAGGDSYIDNFNRDDGAAGNGWSAGTISGNRMVISPTLSAELLTNGNMETGDPPSNWTASNSLLSSAADERTGGSGTKSMNVAYNGTVLPTALQTAGSAGWYQGSVWARNVDTASGARLTFSNSVWTNQLTNALTTWVQHLATIRTSSTSSLVLVGVTVAAGNVRFDDASMKSLTVSTLFATRAEASVNGSAQANITRVANTQAGVAHYADDNNFVVAFMDGVGNVRLEKRIGGVYTTLATVGISYAADAPLKLTRSGTTYAVSYNGVVVVAATSVTDAVMSNALNWGLFSTYAGNSFDQYEKVAA